VRANNRAERTAITDGTYETVVFNASMATTDGSGIDDSTDAAAIICKSRAIRMIADEAAVNDRANRAVTVVERCVIICT